MKTIEVDEIELHLIRRYRALRAHGWGELHVLMENHTVVNSWNKLTDDPRELRAMQKATPQIRTLKVQHRGQ